MFQFYVKIILILLSLIILSCSDKTTSPDTEKPIVQVKYPDNNSYFYEGAHIRIQIEITNNIEIKHLEFYVDDSLEEVIANTPYEFNWNTLGKSGHHSIKITPIGNQDNIGESVILSLNIDYIGGYETGNVTDIDSNIYQTVKIGKQWWMAENLKVKHYANGDEIPTVNNPHWYSRTSGAYCVYNNIDSNITIYGLLYNWYAVTDDRRLAPDGWHVPTDEDWQEFEKYLGMDILEVNSIDLYNLRGNKGGILKEEGVLHWREPNTGATNELGFSARPGGHRGAAICEDESYYASFWTASEDTIIDTTGWALMRFLTYDSDGIGRFNEARYTGFSVRCIKDSD